MKLTGIGSTSGSSQSKRTGKTDKSSAGSFARQLSEVSSGPEEVAAFEGPTSVGGVEALLAAQSVNDATEEENRKRQIQRGEDILDKLEELRHCLLMGVVPKEKLEALAQMVRDRRDAVPDPRLAGLLDEIELRAEVELAKLSRNAG